MQAQSARPIQTFTIGFHEEGYNEAHHAKAVACHLGTAHTELYVTPEEAMSVIPKLPCFYDEPFSDSSQIPTLLVSALARRDVTVTLSGDGGDEMFGGYDRYLLGRKIWQNIGWMPSGIRACLAKGLRVFPAETWARLFRSIAPMVPAEFGQRNPGEKIHRLAEILGIVSPETFYLLMVSHWKECASVVLGASEPPTVLTDSGRWLNQGDFAERMMYLDSLSYLPDDILVKVDRASMAVSLEARVPFLDHRVVEFAWRLPLSMKVRNGKGKRILQKVLNKYVPAGLMNRPKMGFAVPIIEWLGGPLREWAEDLLDEKRLKDDGIFDPVPIRQKWEEHLSGHGHWQFYLWDVLMFQAWKQHTRL
jgi:asparagine synthase (glutamine-hydrolysing)